MSEDAPVDAPVDATAGALDLVLNRLQERAHERQQHDAREAKDRAAKSSQEILVAQSAWSAAEEAHSLEWDRLVGERPATTLPRQTQTGLCCDLL
jgi:hypothetical protein